MGREDQPILVIKFGHSVLRSPAHMQDAVHEIYRYFRRGTKIVAVVSAIGDDTDALLRLHAETFAEGAPCSPQLLSLGEQKSAALLQLALDRVGAPALLMNLHELGLRASGPPLDAVLESVDPAPLRRALAERDIVVAPGYFATDEHGRLVALGRGGSDLTAAALAGALGADLLFIKDVDAVYSADPHKFSQARRLVQASWSDLERIGGGVIQAKAVEYAAARGLRARLGAIGACDHTEIGPPRMDADSPPPRRLRTVLLGAGVVGGGVYKLLQSHQDKFDVTQILVRNRQKHIDAGMPADLLTDDPSEVEIEAADLVIEALNGVEPAFALLLSALRNGATIVSANKQLLARKFDALDAAAGAPDRIWRSAAAAGAAPLLERLRALRKRGEIVAIEGVLNGTTNFMLDAIRNGSSYADALAEAQKKGFAEADPSDDVDGADAAAKLALAARAGLGETIDPDDVTCETIRDVAPERLSGAGGIARHVARLDTRPYKDRASVRLEALPPDHFLAGARNEENRIVVTLSNGEAVKISGKGAGRWPTAEAVFADAMSAWRMAQRCEAGRRAPCVAAE
ncbi:MAG: hypothetical protein Tsb0010_03950 [Parvularculaceae bacterium]